MEFNLGGVIKVNKAGSGVFKFTAGGAGNDAPGHMTFAPPTPAQLRVRAQTDAWCIHPSKVNSTDKDIQMHMSNIQRNLGLTTGAAKNGGTWTDKAMEAMKAWTHIKCMSLKIHRIRACGSFNL